MSDAKNDAKSGQSRKRRAADPYTVHLGNEEYILTEGTLTENVDGRVLRQRTWHFPDLKFISFNKGKLELQNTYDNISHKLLIQIEKNKLQVSCSCNDEAEMLCRHAYKGIERMIQFDHSDFFQQYRPNGLMDIATAHKRYFTIKPNAKGLDISPKDELGAIYQLNNEIQNNQFRDLLRFPAAIKTTPKELKGLALTYIIMFSHRNKLLPLLMPCVGRLNKAGDSVKGFMNFLTGAQTEYDQYLTDDQKILNKSCYDIWKLAEKLPGLINPKGKSTELRENFLLLFDLWQSIIPTLREQRFVFSYYFYRLRELKGKPRKQRIDEVRIAASYPALSFRLTDKGPFYQFEMKVATGSVEVKNFGLEPTLFISKAQTLFFLSSLRDAAVAEWMRTLDNRITIFKEHFVDFETSFLQPLRQCYQVELLNAK